MAKKWTGTTLVDTRFNSDSNNKALLDLLDKVNQTYLFIQTNTATLQSSIDTLTTDLATVTTNLSALTTQVNTPLIYAHLTGQPITTTGADVVWTAVESDTASAYNVSTGIYTIPMDGLYLLTTMMLPTYSASPVNFRYKKNNALFSPTKLAADSSSTAIAGMYNSSSYTLRFVATDTIRIFNPTAFSSLAGTAAAWTITRLGA